MPKKYRPANGSEGEAFYSQWCADCFNDSEDSPCEILGRIMAFNIDDSEYPVEWIAEGLGGICTQYNQPIQYVHPDQIPLFQEVAHG